jgi:SAM-dependent methyltransferase
VSTLPHPTHPPHLTRWHSENGTPPPWRVVVVDDRLRADDAYRMARDGTALLWRGDYPNARQLLRALGRRCDRGAPPGSYHHHRRARGRRARTLSMVVVELGPDYGLALRRAPDVRQACEEAYGPPRGRGRLVSLTEVLGVIGAHRWRVAGVEVPALGARVHPHYGVFAPTRQEYVDLVAQAPLPGRARGLAFDIGTGTGVLAAVLARRGVGRVVATDVSGRAVACARENAARLGLAGRVEVVRADLFPPGRAGLVVCNPPWLPGHAVSELERALLLLLIIILQG